MLYVKPDYYDLFKCIAEKCRHNCCIGWEIDIDDDTLRLYDSIKGGFGDRLKAGISRDRDDAHFILSDGDRCPFLNGDNLCDIITSFGEDHLCTICREHPRFHNELPYRTESGLGACCEECSRIILSKKTPFELIKSGDEEYLDEIVMLRDRVTALLCDRSLMLEDRIKQLSEILNISLDFEIGEPLADFFTKLERLDPLWTDCLEMLKVRLDDADINSFKHCMHDRQTEYEQITVYFIYRHFANALDLFDAAIRGAFAVLSYRIVFTLGAVLYKRNGAFSFEDQVELLRLYSSEIEYSQDNLDAVLLMLEENYGQAKT